MVITCDRYAGGLPIESGILPLLKHACGAMLAAKSLAIVTPEANLRECISCMSLPSANKAAHSGFETSPEVQNRGISGPTKRTSVLHFLLKKYFL